MIDAKLQHEKLTSTFYVTESYVTQKKTFFTGDFFTMQRQF